MWTRSDSIRPQKPSGLSSPQVYPADKRRLAASQGAYVQLSRTPHLQIDFNFLESTLGHVVERFLHMLDAAFAILSALVLSSRFYMSFLKGMFPVLSRCHCPDVQIMACQWVGNQKSIKYALSIGTVLDSVLVDLNRLIWINCWVRA